MRFDVAIIGAGPAGSTLAALLAGRGISTALIDRDEFPRDKLCGEFVSYDALPIIEALGLLPAIDAAEAPRIRRCRVAGRRRSYEFDLPAEARGVSRLMLDDLLYRTAVARGATAYSGWTATRLEPSVVIERDGEAQTIDAQITIGAWGRWGRFDVQLGRAFVRAHSHRNFGFKRHYRKWGAGGLAGVCDRIDLYSFKGGYLGVSCIEGGLTNICGLASAARIEGLRGRWPAFIDAIRSEEPHLEQLFASHEPAQDDFLSSEPVIFRARSAVEDRVVMIGDASGIIDPLAGNGIAMAMQSALLAAPHVLQLLAKNGDERAVFADYRRTHHRDFAKRIRWSRRVAHVLSRPSLLDSLLALVRAPRFGRFLAEETRATRQEVERRTAQWFSC